MNIILVVCTLVVTINAIRVPTVWPDENSQPKHLRRIGHGHYHSKVTVNNRENFRIHPHKTKIRKNFHVNKKPFRVSKLPPRVQHFHSKPKKFFRKHKTRDSPWMPILPSRKNTNFVYTPLDLKQYPQAHYKPASSEYVTSRSSPLYKNYRDDRTYEQEDTKNERIAEPSPDVERPPIKESDHEHPLDIPTAPIYPGEGEWAKPGQKHKPFISKQKYSDLPQDSEEKPDGFEIFEKGQKLYDNKQTKFIDTRKKIYPDTENNEEQHNAKQREESESSEEEDGFVPSTMYVQVRRSENEEHLPRDSADAENGRLKEVIKDSKILTVYTEEGYEDSAYDHAGHEKEAEDSQGYKEYNKEEEKKLDPKKGSLKNHKTTVGDQTEEGSSKMYKQVEKPNKSKKKKYIPKNKNKLFKTESTKTMKLKEEPDGTQMEITSEVKTMTNPENDGKIVQVLPKVIKYSNHTNQTPQKESDTASTIQHLSSTNLQTIFSPSNTRKKRFANDFPKIDVKTDFINGVIGNDNSNYNTIKEKEKYPYYNSKYINPNSPLKYSENMDNIPIKKEGEMTFYERANEVQCPEVEEDIEAIPRRIQDVEESVNNGEKLEDSEEAGKSPRLGKLGQRIDCFKRKYFGENPLDSPFFKEKEVESVPPLFKVLQERSAGFQAHHGKTKEAINNNYKKKYHSKFSVRGKKQPSYDTDKQNSVNDNEELDSEEIINNVRIHKQLPEKESNNLRQSFEDVNITPEVEVINVDSFKSINHVSTESPPVSLITTPNYSIDITPKHIYDQIKLLDFLPSVTTATILSFTDQPRKGKLVEDVTESAELKMGPQYHSYNQRRPMRRKNKRPHFDVESFVQDSSRRVTITPNSYRTEENSAYEQTPLDQMNVFADVFNNIRNGSNDPLRVGASSYQKPDDFNILQKPVVRMRVPPKKIHIKVPDSVEHSNDRKLYYITTTVPTIRALPTTKSKRGSIRYALTTEKELNYDDYDTEDSKYSNDDKSIKTSTSAFVEDEGLAEDEDSEASGTHTTETIRKPPAKKVVDIFGLVPPSKYHYRTIYQPIEEIHEEPIVSESEIINNYHVLGMKPPSTKQKVYDYSDFQRLLSLKNHKYRNHRRGKRSPNRKSYFEVVRGQNSQDLEAERKEEEEDDYVPHRPKNWHWDEKLKKIVYDKPNEEDQSNKSNTEEGEEEEEIVEIEVEDTPSRNIQQTTTRRSFTSTTPINGPSYVDFVQLLKSKKEYVSIPDPTTTKDGLKMESTTLAPTIVKADPTKPPEFLSFVSKLRQSDSYKIIEEKNETKSTTTTTEAPEDEEVDEEDTDTSLSNIQNSPGRGAVDIGQNFKIFDVNDFLPKVKTYSPRTEIDYSKYKTIQRPRPQTTPQPDEDEKEEAMNIEKPHTSFVIKEPEESPSEPSTEGKVEIFEVSRPTTTSTTTTTTVRIQKTRRRRPTTTHRTIAPSATNTKEEVVAVPPKPKRVYPRRRPTHIRSRTTTPKTEDDAETEESHKVVIRSHKPVERNPKIISLEAIIQMDQPKKSGKQISSKSTELQNKTREVTIDDILKNINRLKEVSVEEVVHDYSLDTKNDEEDVDSKDEYFEDDNTKIGLDDGSTTNRKLVISKNKQQGMFYYTSVR